MKNQNINLVNSYSIALFKLIKEKNNLKKSKAEIEYLLTFLNKNKDFYLFLKSNEINYLDKKKYIEYFNSKISLELLNFFKIFVFKKIFNFLNIALKKVVDFINQDLNIKVAHVYSLFPLKKNQINILKTKLIKKINSEVEIINKIDQDLISGIKVEISGTIYDYSIASQLEQIKKKMLEGF